MSKPYSYFFKNKNSEQHNIGTFKEALQPKQLAQHIITNFWNECERHIYNSGQTFEWAINNPVEALRVCSITTNLTIILDLSDLD